MVEGLTLRDIASIAGVSRERVRRLPGLRFGLSGNPYFKSLYVCEETITTVELAGPFAEIRDLRDTIHGVHSTTLVAAPATTVVASTIPQDAKTPAP